MKSTSPKIFKLSSVSQKKKRKKLKRKQKILSKNKLEITQKTLRSKPKKISPF